MPKGLEESSKVYLGRGGKMRRHPNGILRTSSGRLAGSGILYDRCDDETTLKTHQYKTNRCISIASAI